MIRSNLRRSGSVLLAFALGACAPPAPPAPSFTADDEAAIGAVVQAALAIANGSQDWDAYAQTYYAADATVLPPNQTAIQGHAAIADFLRGFPPMSSFESTKVDMQGAGDLAYVYGTYRMTLQVPAGPAADEGKYIEVWKRQADGSWKVAYDIFNSDLPPTSEEG